MIVLCIGPHLFFQRKTFYMAEQINSVYLLKAIIKHTYFILSKKMKLDF